MQSQLSFFVGITFSFIAWGIVATRYIWPEIRLRQRAEALRPLLILSTVSQPFAAIVVATLIVPVAVALIAGGMSATTRAALDAAPLSWLVGVQVYRILGFIFLRLWLHGRLPVYFALPAGIGDMLVGVNALPLAFALRSDSRLARRLALGWNVFGILDLVNAVTKGITTALAQVTSNTSPLLSYPLVLVPAFGVPLSLILHGLSIPQLRRRVITRSAPGRGSNLQAVEAA
jgi:hypothetical protein